MSMRFLFAGYDAAIFAVTCCCVIAVRGSILSRGVRWLVGGLVSALISVTLMGFRPHLPGLFPVVGICLFGYFALMHQAIADILNSSLRFLRLGFGLAFLVGAVFYLYGVRAPNLHVCIYAISAIVAFQLILSSALLLASGDEALRYQFRVMSALLAVFILLLGSLIVATAIGVSRWSYEIAGNLQGFFTLAICILGMALAGAILWLGWSVQQRNLESQANIDPLTGLLNRRALDQILNGELSSDQLEPGSICLVLIDLDAFRNVNESYGQLIGDEVIRQVGRLLKACTRSTDDVARYGGEKYAMILRRINRPRAESAAERLRCAVSSIQGLPEKIHVTASFGLAMNREGENLQSFFARSEEALHLSKRSGRNMVRVHTGGLQPTLVYTEGS